MLLIVAAAVWRARDLAAVRVANAARTEAMREHRAELALELQTTSLSNCEWVRVGSPNDGGYAMCGNLMAGVQAAYSYGIGGNDDWGCQISTARKVPVHQYDCFEPESDPCPRGDQRKHVECVGDAAGMRDGRSFGTLANHFAGNGDIGKTKIVKMDIEGGEWQSILAAPDDLFESIVQMPMELHGIDEPQVLEGLRKLKKHFYLVSVHFNNWQCSDMWAPFPNSAYQVLFVNRKVGIPGPAPPGAATLDSALAPDNRRAAECATPVGR